MGLLSDPEYGSVKWVKVLKKVHAPLCFLCYIGALVWFVMLGHWEFNNETYFSENALLPGLVTNEFNAEQSSNKFMNELVMELEDKYYESDNMPVPWLVAKMSQLDLEVYTHNFTLDYPYGYGQVYEGTNVYGILRAPRTSSLEAIVITTPYRPLSSHQKSTVAGMALMLAFAQFARPQKYWAKDIIFLFTEHEQLGIQAWLEAYHGLQSDAETFHTSLGSFWKPSTSKWDFSMIPGLSWGDHQKCLKPGKLQGRSGSIQAAINLEIHSPKIKYIEVKIEGLNGQLPNLDLVNLVHKLCVKSGIHHSYKNSYSWVRSRSRTEDWIKNIWTMLGMVSAQIAGVPNGNHGLFHRFNIEAVTLEGRDAQDPAGIPPRVASLSNCNFQRLGIALESILRSLNNLLERFHQSYFFYVLAATNRFISIGQYMPSLCLLCVAMLIRALYLWVTLQDDDDDKQTNKQTIKKDENTQKSQADEQKDKNEKKSDSEVPGDDKCQKVKKKRVTKRESREISQSMVNMGANYLLVHLLGYTVMNMPYFFTRFGAIYYELPSEVSLFYGLVCASIASLALGPLVPRVVRASARRPHVVAVNILVLVELATVCLAIGMHNFSLGFVVAVIYTPLALVVGVVGKNDRRVWVWSRRAWCVSSAPLLVLFAGMACYSRSLFPEDALLTSLGRARDAAMQAIMFAVVDSKIYGNWLFNVITTTVLPIWIIFWQILCNTVDDTL